MSACVFPEDERGERTILGINSHEAMPEGIDGHCLDVLNRWTGHVQDIIDGLLHNLDQDIRINRNLALA